MPNRVPLLLFFSSYVKLQDAYVAESGTYVGNWTMIGYNMPQSNNFNYTGAIQTNTLALAGLQATEGWSATNKAKLNDCAANSKWSIQVEEAQTANAAKGSPISYTAATPAATNGSTSDCSQLTPNFTFIGQ